MAFGLSLTESIIFEKVLSVRLSPRNVILEVSRETSRIRRRIQRALHPDFHRNVLKVSLFARNDTSEELPIQVALDRLSCETGEKRVSRKS